MEWYGTFKDDFHNTARIDKHIGPAYYNGPCVVQYRLTLIANYDHNMVYHVSVYESWKEAMEALKKFSCGTFHPTH